MELDKNQYSKLDKIFKKLGEEGLYLNHYQLAIETEVHDVMAWKYFLMDPKTVDYISTEMNIIRGAAMNTIVANSANSNSVGQSQLLNALQKIDEKATHKEGPAFIYCHVPLNNAQKQAPNIRSVGEAGITLEDDEWILEV